MNAAHLHAGLHAPATIAEYLERLRLALAGADPALVQDALYDAEDYLRSEMAANPGRSEAEVIASVAGSYGAPDEVADIYRETEVRVQSALLPPRPRSPARRSPLARFFGVALEPRTYGALFYMLLSIATGTFYFSWIVTGASLSAGLSILIIGIPFLILFFASVRVLSLVEGRLVEVMLGERMPRRPLYAPRDTPVLERIKDLFVDPRTWGTMLYMLLMLPLGIAYFTLAVTMLALAVAFVLTPFLGAIDAFGWDVLGPFEVTGVETWQLPLVFISGIAMLFLTLHAARGIGYVHGQIARHLLVKSGPRYTG